MEGDAKLQEFLLDLLKHDIVHLDKEQQNSPRSLWSQVTLLTINQKTASLSTKRGKQQHNSATAGIKRRREREENH